MRAEAGSPNRRGTDDLQERVHRAAEKCLERDGAVGPLELLQEMLFLHPVHFKGWQQGNPYYTAIEPHIQCGPAKLEKTYRYFHEWVERRGLTPVEADYLRSTRRGPEPLAITADGTFKYAIARVIAADATFFFPKKPMFDPQEHR